MDEDLKTQLQDADLWSDKLLERIPGTEFLKLNVVAGGEGGGPFDAIQDLSRKNNIPPENLQLAQFQLSQENEHDLIKSLRMDFKNLNADDDDTPFLRSTPEGYHPHLHSYNHSGYYNVFENRIQRIWGTWGSTYGPHIIHNYCIESMNLKLENGEEIQRGFGSMYGTREFNICAPQDFFIVNFYGQSGWALDQIGVYLKTDRPLEWSLQTHFQFPELFKKQIRTFLLCVGRYCKGGIGQDVIQKIVKNMLLNCGMTVDQYREMTSSLVFNQKIFKLKFGLEQEEEEDDDSDDSSGWGSD